MHFIEILLKLENLEVFLYVLSSFCKQGIIRGKCSKENTSKYFWGIPLPTTKENAPPAVSARYTPSPVRLAVSRPPGALGRRSLPRPRLLSPVATCSTAASCTASASSPPARRRPQAHLGLFRELSPSSGRFHAYL